MDEDSNAPRDPPSSPIVLPDYDSRQLELPDVVSPESAQIDTDEPEAPQTTTTAPPLGIVHLMLWVTCWAVYSSLMRTLNWNELSAAAAVVVVVVGFQATLAWSVLAIFVVRRLRGVEWAIEPGEWLGAVSGIEAALWVSGEESGMGLGTANVLCGCILAALVINATMPLRWKLAMAVMAACHALGFLAPFDARLWAVRVVIVVAITIIAVRDRHLRRGWLHWIGLLAWSLKAAHDVLFHFLATL